MFARFLFTCITVTLAVSLAPSQTVAPGTSIPGRFLVSYRNATIPASAESAARAMGARLVQRHESIGVAIVQATTATAAATRRQLALDPNVEFVVEDRVVNAHSITVSGGAAPLTGADSLYYGPQGWAVRQVGGFGSSAATPNTPGPWNKTTGAGVRIAILDSGLDAAHPDLAPNLVVNLSEIDQSPLTGLPSACDDGLPQDQQGHGTWVASLAAGALGPNTGMVAGVAPSATLLNIKVLERLPAATLTAADPTGCIAGQASGLASWMIQGIADAVAQRADIISISSGTLVDVTTGDGAGLQAIFNRATHAAANAGIILIAAAGNDGIDLSNQRFVELPAQSRDVLAVAAATNPACAENLAPGATCLPGPITLPYYSNFSAPLNALAAPGGSYPASPTSANNSGWIWGACSSGVPGTADGLPANPGHSLGCFGLGHTGYVQAMGTSAAASLAAGVAALLRAANPNWSAATVLAALRASADVLPTLPLPLVDVSVLLTPTSNSSHRISRANQR